MFFININVTYFIAKLKYARNILLCQYFTIFYDIVEKITQELSAYSICEHKLYLVKPHSKFMCNIKHLYNTLIQPQQTLHLSL